MRMRLTDGHVAQATSETCSGSEKEETRPSERETDGRVEQEGNPAACNISWSLSDAAVGEDEEEGQNLLFTAFGRTDDVR